jgi:DNA polymerase-3 subunit epsilon
MTMKNTFLVIDTETGGLNPEINSILSIAGVVWTPRGEISKLFDLYVQEPTLNVEDQALKVNNINLEDVYKHGLTPEVAVGYIRGTLDAHFGTNRRPIQLVGHNVAFDLGFIRRLYRLAGANFKDDFRDRALDSCSILQFLMISGKIKGFRASADVLFESAGVKIDEKDRHTALGDALATAKSLDILLDKF